MKDVHSYLLVDANVLPTVLLKVVEAKRLIARGIAKNSTDAAKQAGISRSAYYKYKDFVFQYSDKIQDSIITISMTLDDRPGVLSKLINKLYETGANILTVNQSIPIDGVAPVTVSVRTGKLKVTLESLLNELHSLDGVIEAKLVSGE